MTLKLEGDLDILTMYLHTKNKATSLRHSKLRIWIEEIRKYVSRSKEKVKISKAPNYLERYRNSFSDQVLAIYDQ